MQVLVCSWNHEYYGSLAKLTVGAFSLHVNFTRGPRRLHLLCKRPELFMIP